MKKIITILIVTLGFYPISFGQNPNNWCPSSVDEADSWDSTRYEGVIPKIQNHLAPEIDGELERIWYCAVSPLEMQQRTEGLSGTPDPNLDVDVRILYDSLWLYIGVNILQDNDLFLEGDNPTQIDHVNISFQNTWGGKGTIDDHCGEENWWWYYWEQDGDKNWTIPATKNLQMQWLDNDTGNNCAFPHPAEYISDKGWYELEVLDEIKYEVNVTALADETYRITYEMAYNFKNFLGFDYLSNIPDTGHIIGLEISIRDMDAGVLTGQYNMSLANNKAWCLTTAASKMTLGDIVTWTDTCGYGVDICETDPYLCIEPTANFQDQKSGSELHLYPNPVKNLINISSDVNIQTIEILDLRGIPIFESRQNIKSIDLSRVIPGIYMIKIVSTDNQIITRKIIKQ